MFVVVEGEIDAVVVKMLEVVLTAAIWVFAGLGVEAVIP